MKNSEISKCSHSNVYLMTQHRNMKIVKLLFIKKILSCFALVQTVCIFCIPTKGLQYFSIRYTSL